MAIIYQPLCGAKCRGSQSNAKRAAMPGIAPLIAGKSVHFGGYPAACNAPLIAAQPESGN